MYESCGAMYTHAPCRQRHLAESGLVGKMNDLPLQVPRGWRQWVCTADTSYQSHLHPYLGALAMLLAFVAHRSSHLSERRPPFCPRRQTENKGSSTTVTAGCGQRACGRQIGGCRHGDHSQCNYPSQHWPARLPLSTVGPLDSLTPGRRRRQLRELCPISGRAGT